MRIKWADVNWAVQPGLHRLPDGREVLISAVEIARWRNDPEGAHDVHWYPSEIRRPAFLTLTDFHAAPANAREDREPPIPPEAAA